MALIISLAILSGFEKQLKKSAVKFTSHITIYNFNKEPIADYQNVGQRLTEKFDFIKKIEPVREREGLIKTKSHTDGVIIKSFDFNNDITNFAANIKRGKKSFSTDSSKELIVGERLIQKLGVDVGEDVVLYAIFARGEAIPDARIGKFKIVATYQTGMAQYDDALIFMPQQSSAHFFKMDETSCSKIELMVDNIENAGADSKAIMKFLGYPFWTLTYYELHASIFAWIELQKEPIPVVLGLIAIVAVLNIITTLLITVVEKTHTIGILRTLGMSSKSIVSVFVNQGLRLGLLGMAAGAALAFAFSVVQINFAVIKLKGEIYFLDALPIDISWQHYAIVLSLTFVLVLISTIVPAIIASRLKLIKALRFK